MNKASRKSGGIALKQAPEKLQDIVGLLNAFKDFVVSSEMSELVEWGLLIGCCALLGSS